MKRFSKFLSIVLVALMLTNCATVFGGRVTEHQKTRPQEGEQKRQLRAGAFIADLILFAPSLIVDFATGAIYKPKN